MGLLQVIKSFLAMREDADYQQLADDLDTEFPSTVTEDEREAWWQG